MFDLPNCYEDSMCPDFAYAGVNDQASDLYRTVIIGSAEQYWDSAGDCHWRLEKFDEMEELFYQAYNNHTAPDEHMRENKVKVMRKCAFGDNAHRRRKFTLDYYDNLRTWEPTYKKSSA